MPGTATKVTSTVRLVPLMDAVTVLIPALVLVSVCTISPFASEMPVAAIVALLPALKLTLTPDTGRPFASVTVALTLLVVVPLALALLSTGTRPPSVIVAAPGSFGSSGSVPLVISSLSEMPSPSVSGLFGSVPCSSSSSSVRPSPSLSGLTSLMRVVFRMVSFQCVTTFSSAGCLPAVSRAS